MKNSKIQHLFVIVHITLTATVSGIGLSERQSESRPRSRLANLPYPSPLFSLADVDDLGQHQYLYTDVLRGPNREQMRGTLYTCRGGFIDLAHVRKGIDWTGYWRSVIEAALMAQEDILILKAKEPSRYRVRIVYPDFWNHLSEKTKLSYVNEISIIMAQQLAYFALTWHEIITWYGYKSSYIFSEKRSAFSYEDVISNILGVLTAGEAIRDPKRQFNEAVTIALENELERLGLVSQSQLETAVDSVKNKWWRYNDGKKRFLDIGLDDGVISPWLTPELSCCVGAVANDYVLPNLGHIDGRDFSTFYDVDIEPRIRQYAAIRSSISSQPNRVNPQRHFPEIMERIRDEMMSEFGPNVLIR